MESNDALESMIPLDRETILIIKKHTILLK